ncbi:MAG: hypothetical protein WD425_13385 [Nitrospirales bacterium]
MKRMTISHLAFACMVSTLLSGCTRYGTYQEIQDSLSYGDYSQAAERLRRCVKKGSDSRCSDLLARFQESGQTSKAFFEEEQRRKLSLEWENKKLAWLQSLRESNSPWDKLRLALEIQNGTIPEDSPQEANQVMSDAFFGFGECAKNADPNCMSQYASMIIQASETLTPEQQESAKDKAMYWLNLAARYGNDEARKMLIRLSREIPSPDLAMENLQVEANSIAEKGQMRELALREKAQRQQAYYQSQLLIEARRANFINAMNSFLPRTVSCSSNTIGSYTYTQCH